MVAHFNMSEGTTLIFKTHKNLWGDQKVILNMYLVYEMLILKTKMTLPSCSFEPMSSNNIYHLK